MQVSIIIVNYNTKELLLNCLESIYEQTKDISFEIIVSDNGSSDNSIKEVSEKYKEVKIIDNKNNLGFGAANNRALDIAKGDFIFYLNSDTILLNNAVKLFYDYWNTSEIKNLGALGGLLLDEKNKLIHSGSDFPSKKSTIKELAFMSVLNVFLSLLYMIHVDGKKFRKLKPSEARPEGPVDFITGADLFMKNDNLARFDENFFLYFEDTDLQFNLHKNGKECRLIEGPKIIHLCGGSVDEGFNIKRKGTFSRIQFELSRVRYFKKNGNNKAFVFILKLFITLIWLNPFLFGNTKKYINKLWKI